MRPQAESPEARARFEARAAEAEQASAAHQCNLCCAPTAKGNVACNKCTTTSADAVALLTANRTAPEMLRLQGYHAEARRLEQGLDILPLFEAQP